MNDIVYVIQIRYTLDYKILSENKIWKNIWKKDVLY